MFRSLANVVKTAVLAVALSAPVAAPALAVPGELLFDDNFETVDASFGVADYTREAVDNTLNIALDPQMWSRNLYSSLVFGDVDMTVQLRMPTAASETGAHAGLMFWATGYDDFYVFAVNDTGHYGVFHMSSQRMTYPIYWQASDVVNLDPAASNDLRVVTVGDHVTLYLNGQQVARFRGRAPQGGSMVGPYVETYETAAQAQFAAFKIVEPDPLDADPNADPNILIADDFSEFHPAWGLQAANASVQDGAFVYALDPGTSMTQFYGALGQTEDIDAGITARFDGELTAESQAGTGLVFWADGNQAFYTFTIYGNGNIAVYRLINGKFIAAVPVQPAPEAAQADLTAGVRLRVVTNGRRATVYVNDIAVGSFTGQPPQGDPLLGLFTQGDAGITITNDNFLVRRAEVNTNLN